MSEPLAEWLRLREPADAAARSSALTRAVADRLADRQSISVLDLATGTGSTLRYLMPHLPRQQRWLVVDRDPGLLALLPERTRAWGVPLGYEVGKRPGGIIVRGQGLECAVAMLAANLDALDRVPELFAGRHLVSTSALLDLASASWLMTLAGHCRASRACALLALSYDGWSSCTPVEPEDEMVRDLLNAHQIRDKGLGGLAEGPAAAACAVRCFAHAGYTVHTAASHWVLGDGERALQRELVEGWAGAASEMEPAAVQAIERWRQRRIAHIDANRSRIEVGHVDIAAWPVE